MIKIVKVEYEEGTGAVYDRTGNLIGTWQDLQPFPDNDKSNIAIDDVVKLKEAGFTSEEIIELKKKEVIG